MTLLQVKQSLSMAGHRCRFAAKKRLPANAGQIMFSHFGKRLCAAATLLSLLLWGQLATAVNNALYSAAMESITADELYRYVEVLADDVYEGRASGSRGGHAAAQWLIQQLRPFQLTPAGKDGGYVQTFSNDCRNILAL